MWRVPRAITALGMGALAGMGFGTFHRDPTIELLATLGISTLFLFAGLEVRLDELWQGRRMLLQHIAIRLLALSVVTYAAGQVFGLEMRPSALVALALLTPSAGFILDSLPSFGLQREHAFWVRSMTIAGEITSLLVLFFVLQSSSPGQFAIGTAALGLLIVALPGAFSLFAKWLAPVAPKSEFAFLVMMTIGAAFITRQLGAYYLVGAFVVGIVAQRFRERLPALGSEELLHAVEVFASFFVPFYFFSAGLHLEREQFSLTALGTGLGLLALAVPLRVAFAAVHMRWSLAAPFSECWKMGVGLTPTLVFTLVVAEILRDTFSAPDWLFGGLVIYALGTTVLPGLVLKVPLAEIDDPDMPNLEPEAAA
jgi:Kef-type K+ transport system membrane component KefB